MSAVLVPSALALLPAYAGWVDPVADVRAACLEAVAALVGEGGPVTVVSAPPRPDNIARGASTAAGERVGRQLLLEAGYAGQVVCAGDAPPNGSVLFVANGSACRSEKAPGHLDPRAEPFDEAIETALECGDADALRAVDATVAAELWCHDAPVLHALGNWLAARDRVALSAPGADKPTRSAERGLTYRDDSYGVAYWVGVWS